MRLVQFDHTFTPEQAAELLIRIPPDSYHWADIEGRGRAWPPGLDPATRIERYTNLMASGKWKDETLERGFFHHPIRWNEDGEITHGVMRLLACVASGRPFRSAVQCSEEFACLLQEPGGAAILAPSGRPAQRS